eukprot:5840099-Pleurochrysis_carterae.AAC.3
MQAPKAHMQLVLMLAGISAEMTLRAAECKCGLHHIQESSSAADTKSLRQTINLSYAPLLWDGKL